MEVYAVVHFHAQLQSPHNLLLSVLGYVNVKGWSKKVAKFATWQGSSGPNKAAAGNATSLLLAAKKAPGGQRATALGWPGQGPAAVTLRSQPGILCSDPPRHPPAPLGRSLAGSANVDSTRSLPGMRSCINVLIDHPPPLWRGWSLPLSQKPITCQMQSVTPPQPVD